MRNSTNEFYELQVDCRRKIAVQSTIEWRSMEEKINNFRDKTFNNFSLCVGRCPM